MADERTDLPARQSKREVMDTFKDLVDNDKLRQAMAAVLPTHMTPDRIIKLMIAAATKTPQLRQCTPESIIQCMMACSETGLEPGGALGHAYVIPYKTTATFLIGYRGMLDLARRSGKIISIEARVVYKQDRFVCHFGLDSVLEHEPDFKAERNDSDIIAAYAVAKLTDGGLATDVMTRPEIDAIRRRSRAGASGPWVTDFAEMARKTVVRRLFKYLPTSTEKLADGTIIDRTAQAFEREDETQGYIETARAEAMADTLSAGRHDLKRAKPTVEAPMPDAEQDAAPEEPQPPVFDRAGAIAEIEPVDEDADMAEQFTLALRACKIEEGKDFRKAGDGQLEKLLGKVRDLQAAKA